MDGDKKITVGGGFARPWPLIFQLEILQEPGMKITGLESWILHQFLMKGNRGIDTFHYKLIQCPNHLLNTVFAGWCFTDQLCDHTVIVRWYRIARINVCIHLSSRKIEWS